MYDGIKKCKCESRDLNSTSSIHFLSLLIDKYMTLHRLNGVTMKWSLYNFFYELHEDRFVLYNYAVDSVMIITKDVKNIIDLYKSKIDNLCAIHPDLYNELKNRSYVVRDDIDERVSIMENIRSELNSSKKFDLTINPTLDCNLRCWYCYETLIPDSKITSNTLDSIKYLIENIARKQKLEELNLSFFGGEPLFKTREVILSLINHAKRQCELHGKILNIHFTTNATLLSLDIIKKISLLKLNVSIQVPFDGGRDQHNLTKKINHSIGGYDISLRHVRYALEFGVKVAIRCNYTSKNIGSFQYLIDDISKFPLVCRNRVTFQFQQVWQDIPETSTYKEVDDIRTLLSKNGFDNNLEGQGAIASFCYADFENSIVVNYNGDLFKCTARDFKTENRIGVLLPNGNIQYNEKYKTRRDSFFNEECKECVILPICTICSQKRYEYFNKGGCPQSIPEQEKIHQIIYRLKSLYSNYINCVKVRSNETE
jgi:hypothetical protein